MCLRIANIYVIYCAKLSKSNKNDRLFEKVKGGDKMHGPWGIGHGAWGKELRARGSGHGV
jgi:hypothetical protein